MAIPTNEAANDGLKIESLTSETSDSYNVALITHPRFLVVVPRQFRSNPLSRANHIASRLLNSSGASHLAVIASSPTQLGDLLYISLAVLLVIAFIGCSVLRAVQRNYFALLCFQPIFVAFVFILLWAGRNIWKPQHLVLSKDTGMLHSRRNSFVSATEIPLSSIRFFRKTASHRPRFARTPVKYGIEAVTMGSNFLFAFSKSEQVAEMLEHALNRSLRSFQTSTLPAAIIGNTESSSASIVLSKNDISDVECLPRNSEIQYCEGIRCVGFRLSPDWMLKSMYTTSSLFLVWILSLAISLSTGEAAVKQLRHSPSALLGTILYAVSIGFFMALHINRVCWKICADEDNRPFLCRFLSTRKVVHVEQYRTVRLEREEARMLPFFIENRKFGVEQIGGMRYSVVMEHTEEERRLRLLRYLSEGEAMFVISRIGRMFPWLFGDERCSFIV